MRGIEMTDRIAVLMVICAFLCGGVRAESSYGTRPSGTTSNVSKADVSVGPRATRDRLPKNYNMYRDQNLQSKAGYAYAPVILVHPAGQRPMILGPVRPYSDEEYSRLLLSTLKVGSVEPAGSKLDARTVVVEVTDANGEKQYKRAETKVLDVLDRGVLIVDTREEVRLRGVRMVSERDPDEVMRFYAREGIKALRSAAQNDPIYVEFGEPLRDRDGSLLGFVYLKDGTQLNRLMLEQGFGRVEAKDFAAESNTTEYTDAEKAAREARVGIWSK
jgi:endonuclease YncB( thermonuclease family)